ncbi:SigE family RNA polymerase sigma factor [Promicromonospora vindobonensis]|uniref:SigE family RNA polymerase sigma factor n=1 Tax=Promicromonospora vindobonensis TaxID=195748 RepID=A0ABW5W146_9MICO
MRRESGAIMSESGAGRLADDGAGRDVLVEVPRTRDAEFTEFVRECGPYLHRTAYLLCGDRHRAEELVQSTFERVYRTWAKVKPRTQRAYARQILVNQRIDGWRHGRRELFPGADKIPVATTADHASHVVLRDELVRGLAQLPLNQRRVVVLRHLLDLPEAEVARELGIAVGTVKGANSRGLARLRDLLVAGTEAIEPVDYDEQAVLDRSRAALRRRRAGQTVGAACVAVLLVLGVVTRGPVPLPWIGPVVVPGGDLVAPLLDGGPTDGFGPAPRPEPRPPAVVDLAGSTPLACPEALPAPISARAPEPGEDIGPLDESVVVDVADARPLTCYDVDIEMVTPGRIDEQTGVPVTDDGGKQMPLLDGLAENGVVWAAAAEFGPAGTVEGAFVRADAHRSDGPTESIPTDTINDVMLVPYDVAARGDRVTWGETTGGEGATRTSQIRTFRAGTEPRTLATYEGYVGEVALTRDHALWTAGGEDNPSLLTAPIDDPGTGVLLADHVTAFAADDDEVVAALLEPGPGGTRTTTIWLFDGPAGGNLASTTALLSIDHGSADRISEVAVSDDLVAWTTVSDEQETTLFVFDRRGGTHSVVRAGDRGVNGLQAAGGLLLWNSADDENPAGPAYLYRATPSASGHDGPDLAQFPGDTERANLAGDRIAWGEGFVPQTTFSRAWLVEGTVTPTLDAD